jgi:hypothetical protein
LRSAPIASARQWLYRRLRVVEAYNLIAVGSIEACVNTELDGCQHWGLGCHVIVAGVPKSTLRDALRISSERNLPRSSRPLVLG